MLIKEHGYDYILFNVLWQHIKLPAWRAGIPLSTRDDLDARCCPNLLRIEPGSRPTSAAKIKPDKSRVEFVAERIGLEPMDQKNSVTD